MKTKNLLPYLVGVVCLTIHLLLVEPNYLRWATAWSTELQVVHLLATIAIHWGGWISVAIAACTVFVERAWMTAIFPPIAISLLHTSIAIFRTGPPPSLIDGTLAATTNLVVYLAGSGVFFAAWKCIDLISNTFNRSE